jgi:hypothetical protein
MKKWKESDNRNNEYATERYYEKEKQKLDKKVKFDDLNEPCRIMLRRGMIEFINTIRSMNRQISLSVRNINRHG